MPAPSFPQSQYAPLPHRYAPLRRSALRTSGAYLRSVPPCSQSDRPHSRAVRTPHKKCPPLSSRSELPHRGPPSCTSPPPLSRQLPRRLPIPSCCSPLFYVFPDMFCPQLTFCGAYMLTLSLISAILASHSLVSPCTREYARYPFIRSIFVRFRLPHFGQTSISSS